MVSSDRPTVGTSRKIGLQRYLWPGLARIRIFDDLIQSIVQPLCRDVGRVATFRQYLRHGYRRDRNRLLCESFPQKYGDNRESENTRKTQDNCNEQLPTCSERLCDPLPCRTFVASNPARRSFFRSR